MFKPQADKFHILRSAYGTPKRLNVFVIKPLNQFLFIFNVIYEYVRGYEWEI